MVRLLDPLIGWHVPPPHVGHINDLYGSLRIKLTTLLSDNSVFLVTPFSRHRCCLGCVSLRDAVPLICVAELVVIGTLIAVDFYTTDGRMFYTKEVEGQGKAIAIGFTVFLAISIPVIVFTLAAWHFNKPYLYIIHILWQVGPATTTCIAFAMLLFAYGILTRTFSAETRLRTGFLLPSAVVLSLTALVAIVVQSWLFVFIDAMFFEMSRKQRRKNNSSKVIADEECLPCPILYTSAHLFRHFLCS
ncbi:unnamed protein product [Heligmosomoides polygyrus]|uniref:Uncharacterized protein n=1 Tax=Heligmosomoides polygyrus TaxID=6339 RepID=A0A3P8B375_HELPZ|nr:unnamed protein product [Heligmosomoides polygyrus]